MFLLLAIANLASASSLDFIEVGGPWGSPNATDATAVWWNPAGLAAGTGTRFHAEGAGVFASIDWERDDPFYGGSDGLRTAAIAPYVGVATDLGIGGFGLGASLSVPFARAGKQANPIPFVRDYEGPIPFDGAAGRYHTRDAGIQVIQATLAAGYDFGPIAIGAGGGLMFSSWTANIDNVLIVDLFDEIQELNQDPGYTDDMIEDPRYATTAEFGDLRDTVFTFNLGIQAEPIPGLLTVSAAYHHSANLTHTGDVDLHFSCPPQDDTLGRFGSEAFGLCNTDVNAAASVSYGLPSRLYGGVKLTPTPMVDLEVMGGLVTWSRYTDFDVTLSDVETRNDPNDFTDLERTAGLVNQNRLWARDNVNTGWVAVDGKVYVQDFTVGARVTYDGNATPNQALMLNNYDAGKVITSAMAEYRVWNGLSVGLSYSHYFLFRRTITDTGFGVTLDPENRKEDRWFYPQANGVYTGSIDRVGLVVRGQFGGNTD
ncbi:MAG: long-subunit fatty acid transport protein [Myxococcota bacterium]